MVENIENRNERRIHKVAPRYISVDGPDGVGKDTLVRHIAAALDARTSQDQKVSVANPNLFDDTPEAQRLGQKFAELGGYRQPDHRVNGFYLAAYNRNARGLIVPRLNQGHWVVAASSELRPLAFTNAERSAQVARRTQELMFSGTINQGVWPMHRILLESDSEALLTRIDVRGENADDDPNTLEDCENRIASYEWATQLVRNELGLIGEQVRWKRQVIQTVEPNQIDPYMASVAKELTGWILEE